MISRIIEFRKSLTVRFIVVVGSLVLVIQLLFGLYQTYVTSEEQSLDLYNKVVAQARFLGAVSQDNILSNDFYPLENLMRETSRDPEILYSIIVHDDGRSLTNYLDLDNPQIDDAVQTLDSYDVLEVAEFLQRDRNVRQVQRRIAAGSLPVGDIYIGYSVAGLQARANAAIFRTLLQSVLIGLFLSGATVFLFDRQIRRPLQNLGDTASLFAAGDLEMRLSLTGDDEINRLRGAFNGMATHLQETLGELRLLSRVARDTKNMVIITDPHGRVQWVNAAYERLTGYELSECIGYKPGDLLQGENTDLQTVAFMREQLQKQKGFNVEIINYSRTGAEYWVAIEVEPLYDDLGGLTHFIAIETDITERKRSEQLIHAAQLRKSAILQASLDGLISIDEQGDIIEFNPASEGIFGYTEDEVLGRSMADLIIPEEIRAAHTAGFERFLLSRESRILGQRLELSGQRSNGEVFPLELAIIAVDLDDEVVFTAFMRDITERKAGEDSLKKYASELERSNRELQDFAYVASHDLQEPLRKIQAFGSRLESRYKSSLDDRGQMYVGSMQNAAGRMQVLINDLLDFSRVATKARPFVAVDLQTVLENVLSDLEIRIAETDAKIVVPEPLPTLEGDLVQMRQILQNLIGNALKFRKPDVPPVVEITLGVVPDEIKEQLSGEDFFCLEVRDNGIGFDNKYTDKIFQIFQRLHGRSEYVGTGVGLAICRKIAERHGGVIEAHGELGKGSVFSIYLPRVH